MKKKIIITAVVAIVVALLVIAFTTGLLDKVLPAVKKTAPKVIITSLTKFFVLTLGIGYITRALQARKDRFLDGVVDHSLMDGYTLMVGYDFQAKPLIKRLLSGSKTMRVLVLTNRDVRKIRAEMSTELTEEEAKRLLYMRRDLALQSSYAGLRIRGAAAVYVLGDDGASGRDGIVLRASEMIASKAASETKNTGDKPVKAYLQFEDPGVYSQMCSCELSMDGRDGDGVPLFDLEVFNYFDSWVWKCWSEKNSADGAEPYLPLLYKSAAKRVELFAIGGGKAMKSLIDAAVTLMNYGDDDRHCRLSVVSDRAFEVMPPEDAISELPELEMVACPMRDLAQGVAARMTEASADANAATTIVIVEDAPEKAIKTYLSLPFALRSTNVSVLLWMGSQSRNLPDKRLIKVDGDNTQLRYFGMSDCLPWLEGNRHACGADINFYYSVHQKLPKGVDPTLVAAAKGLWNELTAVSEWNASKRWKKRSSINSSGSFKEKAALIAGRTLTPELQLKLLKAEHNRWWTERLLGDWRVGERDNVRRLHPNLVPFEELDDFTKDIDKICIAAMAHQQFIG